MGCQDPSQFWTPATPNPKQTAHRSGSPATAPFTEEPASEPAVPVSLTASMIGGAGENPMQQFEGKTAVDSMSSDSAVESSASTEVASVAVPSQPSDANPAVHHVGGERGDSENGVKTDDKDKSKADEKKKQQPKKKRGQRPRILVDDPIPKPTPKPKTPKPTKPKRAVPTPQGEAKKRKYTRKKNPSAAIDAATTAQTLAEANGRDTEVEADVPKSEFSQTPAPTKPEVVVPKPKKTRYTKNSLAEEDPISAGMTPVETNDPVLKSAEKEENMGKKDSLALVDITTAEADVVDSRRYPIRRVRFNLGVRRALNFECEVGLDTVPQSKSMEMAKSTRRCKKKMVIPVFPKEFKRVRTSVRVAKAQRRMILPMKMPAQRAMSDFFDCVMSLTHSLVRTTKKRKKRLNRFRHCYMQKCEEVVCDGGSDAVCSREDSMKQINLNESLEPTGSNINVAVVDDMSIENQVLQMNAGPFKSQAKLIDESSTFENIDASRNADQVTSNGTEISAKVGKKNSRKKQKATIKEDAKFLIPNALESKKVTTEEMLDFITRKFENLWISPNALVIYGTKLAVDLDPETLRVWNILKDREDGSDPVQDEEDEARKKWWDGQRQIFKRKVDLFSTIMHFILGDRRFTPWKGSVVDSVVGVFLTQNVSDNLSSSAFMSMVARFPSQLPSEDEQQRTEFRARSNNLGKPKLLLCSKEDSPDAFEIESREDWERITSQMQNENEFHMISSQGSTEFVDNKAESANETVAGRSSPDSVITQEKLESPDATEKRNVNNQTPQRKTKKKGKDGDDVKIDWDSLRTTYSPQKKGKQRSPGTLDSVDWEAVRKADVSEVAKTIAARGQHNILAQKIKDFLDRIVKDHGSIDLEWLRDVPPEKAKEYLLDIHGLGLKSVECLRLLTLHHHAFPVDVNVGRIVVRLGWVPLQPLPDGVPIHLLQDYPIMDKIQAYLWPRLCHLDQGTLYELHYHMITFGKVFCTKRNPHCQACPLNQKCKYYASVLSSKRLFLPGLQEKKNKKTSTTRNPFDIKSTSSMAMTLMDNHLTRFKIVCVSNCEPIIEVPPSPEPELEFAPAGSPERDIEDLCTGSDDEMLFFDLGAKMFKEYMQESEEEEMSKAIVAAANIPLPKLKLAARLRTQHQVYALPDYHPLLTGLKRRDRDDLCPYLLAVWIQDTSDHNENTNDNAEDQDNATVPGTLLIPCRTAMRGRFPLNGTYFQVNEVFADHESSKRPIDVPRKWLLYLRTRTLYCGTSVSAVFKGCMMLDIRYCFWRGFVCIRGFDQKTRAPKLLSSKFHQRPKGNPKRKTEDFED